MQEDSLDQLLEHLQFRNEEEAIKMKPTHQYVKEIPYIKNNPREKEVA